MPSLASVRHKIDMVGTDVSNDLRQKILSLNETHESLPHEERFNKYLEVLNDYFREKGITKVKGVADTYVLAALFSDVTGRKRPDGKDYWGTHIFHYHFLVGRQPKDVAPLAWAMIDGENYAPATIQTAILRHVNDVTKQRGLPGKQVFMHVVKRLLEMNDSGKSGMRGGWSHEKQNQIRADYKLPPLSPPGRRKNRKTSADAHEVEWVEEGSEVVETAPEVGEEVTPEVVEEAALSSAPAEKGRKPPRKAKANPEEDRIVGALRGLVSEWIELRAPTISAGDQPRIKAEVRARFSEFVDYVRCTFKRLSDAKDRDEHESAQARAIRERQECRESCLFFGIPFPPESKQFRAVYRERVKHLHVGGDVTPEHRPLYDLLNERRVVIENWLAHTKIKENHVPQ